MIVHALRYAHERDVWPLQQLSRESWEMANRFGRAGCERNPSGWGAFLSLALLLAPCLGRAVCLGPYGGVAGAEPKAKIVPIARANNHEIGSWHE